MPAKPRTGPLGGVDRRTELETHLAMLIAALSNAEAKDVAGLLRERRITLKELAEVPKSNGKSIRDELTARRASRRAAAQVAQASARSGNKRSG